MRRTKIRVGAVCLITALVAMPLASARRSPEQELERLLAGRTAGPSQSCISMRSSSDSTTLPGIGIVYDVGATRYLMRFQGGCPALERDRILITKTPQTQFCRGDIGDVYTQNPATFMGTCTYGEFVPYKKAKGLELTGAPPPARNEAGKGGRGRRFPAAIGKFTVRSGLLSRLLHA